MNILTGIKAGLSAIFGATKFDAQKTFDTVAKGIDQLALTQEEKAEISKEAAKMQIEYAKNTAGENTIRSKTRRAIAVLVTYVFIGLVLGGVIAYPFDTAYADVIWAAAWEVAPYFGGIMGFYFAWYSWKEATKKN